MLSEKKRPVIHAREERILPQEGICEKCKFGSTSFFMVDFEGDFLSVKKTGLRISFGDNPAGNNLSVAICPAACMHWVWKPVYTIQLMKNSPSITFSWEHCIALFRQELRTVAIPVWRLRDQVPGIYRIRTRSIVPYHGTSFPEFVIDIEVMPRKQPEIRVLQVYVEMQNAVSVPKVPVIDVEHLIKDGATFQL